ncbi:unnamed protein product [Gemmata massiliana]|uniref:Uncharacterized protein n=1 Tax=Gemmata massiliana TaxID=1210884 RepID=A0A6P2D0L4_9BACT|nr:unnamed protein product [Gemmata massiliana]
MAFQMRLLLGRADLFDPTLENVLAYLEQQTSFGLEGDDGLLTASFHVERFGPVSCIQAEGIGDTDQFVLTDPERGDEVVKSVTDSGDVYCYAAFCLVGRDLVERALRYFAQTGSRDYTLRWQPVSDLLRSGSVDFA